MKKLLLLIFSISLTTMLPVKAQTVPNTFEIKAKLLTNELVPKTGIYKIRTTLWATPDASDILPTDVSNNLWSETQTITLSDEGSFETMVGNTTPLPSPFDYSTLKYYQTDVAPDNTENWQILDPAPNDNTIDRKNIPSVAFALNSQTLNGYSIGTSANNIPILNENSQIDSTLIPNIFSVKEIRSITDQLGLFMDDDGNVGIGTTTLSGKLSIAGDIALNGDLKLAGKIIDNLGSSGTAGQVLKINENGENVWQTPNNTIAPFITTSYIRLSPNENKVITLEGCNFTTDTQIEIPDFDGSINSITAINPTKLEIDITTGSTETQFDIILKNNNIPNTLWEQNGAKILDVKTSYWIDLRENGEEFDTNDITTANGMNIERDSNGMYFTGLNPWSSFVKFNNLEWQRKDSNTLEWIFTTPDNIMMIGIGSTATNESSTTQYNQAEVQAYFTNSTTLWGLYGNNGTIGSNGYQTMSESISTCTSNVFKAKFANNGANGENFTLYCLPSSDEVDWDNEDNIITSIAIGGTLYPNEKNIMPFIIPQNGGDQRFISLKVQ